ncbi:MAG: spermidine/putrescine ABC transporter substrate-binding protein [Ruminococcaceae bacterium]|jgi:spermidine/putrescine transport system substrate-binding protein|nr:spermidine/putrescine ABC transporter substrate-binding protein [Oscillospiraceae bacterium]
MKKKLLALLCAAMLLLSLTGCAGSGKTSNDELVLYTWEEMFPQEVLDGFTKKTGVKIIYSNFDYDETMLEKLTQAKGGDYDVVIADDYIIEQAISAGLVSEIDKSVVTNFSNINPRYQGQFYDPEDKYTVPYGCGIPLIVYDPAAVDFEIKGYNDLWNPALKDSVAITANYRVINGITLLSMGKSMNEEDLDVIAQAGEKLLALAPNIRLIQDDNTQNALLNGEAAAAFLYTSQVTQVMAENPNLKVVYPEEGLGFGIMAAFIPSNAPNKQAANEFLRYLLEPEISKACMEYIGYVNTTGAADSIVNPMLVAPESAGSGEFIMNVSEEANDAYNRNWTAFKAACGQ